MSASILHLVRRNGDVEADLELRNGWGTAPRIWDAIYERYYERLFGADEATNRSRSWLSLGSADMQKFWQLADDQALPSYVRLVFALTFDGAVLYREDFLAAASALDRFDADYSVVGGRVNHLSAWAAWLRRYAQDDDVTGAVLTATTVCDPWHGSQGPDGEWVGPNLSGFQWHRVEVPA